MLGVFKNNSNDHAAGLKKAEGFSGYDDRTSRLFVAMRQATNYTQLEIAERLGTNIKLIHLLESGAVVHLNDWGEVERVVRSYAALLDISAVPALERLHYLIGTVCKRRIPPLRIEISRPDPISRPVHLPEKTAPLKQGVPAASQQMAQTPSMAPRQPQAKSSMTFSNSLSRRIATIHDQETPSKQRQPQFTNDRGANRPQNDRSPRPLTPMARHQQISQAAAQLAARRTHGEISTPNATAQRPMSRPAASVGMQRPPGDQRVVSRTLPPKPPHMPKPMTERPSTTPLSKEHKIKEIGKMADRLSFHLSEQSATYDEANEAINLSQHDLGPVPAYRANARYNEGMPLKQSQKPFGFAGLLVGVLLVVGGMVYYADHLPEGARVTNLLRNSLGIFKEPKASTIQIPQRQRHQAKVKHPSPSKISVDRSGAVIFSNADLIK